MGNDRQKHGTGLNQLFAWIIRALLRFRYRVKVSGAGRIAERGKSGILFLPNHPALIDPIILTSHLYPKFAPRPLADQAQLERPLIGWLSQRIRTLPIPRITGQGSRDRQIVLDAIDEIAASLDAGDNVILYPAGEILRTKWSDLGANSAVETILSKAPHTRVVLVRTSGLWGSALSRAGAKLPEVAPLVKRAVGYALANFVFFSPRREVEIDLAEPSDLPRNSGGRAEINRYLETHYNQAALDALYVPYTIWERGGPRRLEEPKYSDFTGSVDDVPPTTRDLILSHLTEVTGTEKIVPEMKLAHDLGLDSLAIAELIAWVEGEFGFPVTIPEAVRTVSDLLLAASGMGIGAGEDELASIPSKWFDLRGNRPLSIAEGETIATAFLAQAGREPDLAICADQIGGVRTNRDLITATLVMTPEVEKLKGDAVGIMLPAGIAAMVTYLAVLFSGKRAVFLNWTAGSRNLTHAMKKTGAQSILTASALINRLKDQGIDLSEVEPAFLYLETIREQLPLPRKLFAFISARLSWRPLRKRAERVKPEDAAVILFTSGSESMPKAVPLTHRNVLTNIRDAFQIFDFGTSDRLLGMLPPFHSFGFTATLAAPLVAALPVAYHPNPTEGQKLARLIKNYKASVTFGTPTFLSGIFRSADEDSDLSSLRTVVSGAEKCPDELYAEVERRWPALMVLEGYGITECSPIVSVTPPDNPIRGSIGMPLPSMEIAIVDVDSGARLGTDQRGMLLVRGPNVFPGYIDHDGESPFVDFEGKSWYRTGDLVTVDPQGCLRFSGRLKRFVKIGGEMISLPAIEEVLLAGMREEPAEGEDEGPPLAVTSTGEEGHPELVLFTTVKLDRAGANALIKSAGLSPLHNIRRVVEIDAIPLLGTGKTDYRGLRVEG